MENSFNIAASGLSVFGTTGTWAGAAVSWTSWAGENRPLNSVCPVWQHPRAASGHMLSHRPWWKCRAPSVGSHTHKRSRKNWSLPVHGPPIWKVIWVQDREKDLRSGWNWPFGADINFHLKKEEWKIRFVFWSLQHWHTNKKSSGRVWTENEKLLLKDISLYKQILRVLAWHAIFLTPLFIIVKLSQLRP